jgi:hypothetical protein
MTLALDAWLRQVVFDRFGTGFSYRNVRGELRMHLHALSLITAHDFKQVEDEDGGDDQG